MAVNNHYWNKLLSDKGPKVGYTAIAKATSLEVLTLVDDYFVRRHGIQAFTSQSGMDMRLEEIPLDEFGVRKVRWKKEVIREGKEMVWKTWDVNLTNSEGIPRRFPEIRFARAFLVNPS